MGKNTTTQTANVTKSVTNTKLMVATVALLLAAGAAIFAATGFRTPGALYDCRDTDGGQNYTERGVVAAKNLDTNAVKRSGDKCRSETTLLESYCKERPRKGDRVPKKEIMDCEKEGLICSQGACVKSPSTGSEIFMDGLHIPSQCAPIIFNGDSETKFSFIIAFVGLTQEEIDAKGYDIARAQFYRSEYDHSDTDFGFKHPNDYVTRAGLFEIEPFRTNIDKFNLFYLSVPIPDDWDSSVYGPVDNFVTEYCPFMEGLNQFTDYRLVTLKHRDSPGYAWILEDAGAFNHEFGHGFNLALVDEYYTNLELNDLTPTQIEDWNNRLSNCDYGRPFTPEEYNIGAGYCTKWCDGVEPTNYLIYKTEREFYDQCQNLLTERSNREEWLDYCSNQLNFSRYLDERGYLTLYLDDSTRTNFTNVSEACQAAYDSESSKDEVNKAVLCNAGSLHAIWDMSIGHNCIEETGCYAGCGGFEKDSYYGRMGSFGDAFRSNSIGLMGGGGYPDMSHTLLNRQHTSDDDWPTFGNYNIQVIADKFDELGLR
jgi:hypothetical protein